ncbi:MAG: transglutaminase domain-containing protein [Proteobacteria bacterium]|nr:transglutaminase domain-containing protein [Pseudomonadota bacterium]
MRKSLVYKIFGIVIVAFWLCVIAELVKKTHFSPEGADVTQSTEKRPPAGSSENWMEILCKGRKVGYTVTRVTKIKKEFEVREEIFLTVNLMGSVQKIMSCTRAMLDEQFLLNRFDFSICSDLITFKISGQIEGNSLSLVMGEPGKEQIQSIELPERPMISAGLTQFFKPRTLKIGESFRFPLFDPASMTTNPATVKVVAKEKIKLHDQTYKAFRLEMNFLGRPLVFWLDEEGVPLKEKGFMGFTLVRSNPIRAQLDFDESKKLDFYDLSAIRVKKKLKSARKLSYLRVELNHVPASLSIDNTRQSLNGRVLSVTKESPPFTASYALPYGGNDNELLYYLEPEFLVQSEDKEIKGLARAIVKDTTDPLAAARMIMGWVFENIDKVPVVSIPDAKAILTHRKGDCNEHATLLTALLRAVGVPARIVVGLVYKDGKFYYHAWNEAYLDRWISLDAVLNQMPVDATHIKLVDGGIEKQIQIVGTIGTLAVTILDYR